MSAPWKKYIPKKVTRKRKPSKRFKVKTKTSFRSENLAEPFDYLAAFEDCHGDKAAMAKILYDRRTPGERALAHFLRYLHIEHSEQHVLYGWIVDFFLPQLNAVVEVDGSYHLIPKRAAEDRHRDAVLRSKGLRVLRYDTDVCESRPRWVAEDIAKRLASPPPDFSTLAAAARPTRSVSRTPETQAAVTPRMEIPHAEKLPGETGS
jgi:very-short-patch-repair endonuclease